MTTTINPDALRSYSRVAAGQPTDALLLAVKYADRPEIFLAAITELRGRDDYQALLAADWDQALAEFAAAEGYRFTRAAARREHDQELGDLLDPWLGGVNGWTRAVAMDELHDRALCLEVWRSYLQTEGSREQG